MNCFNLSKIVIFSLKFGPNILPLNLLINKNDGSKIYVINNASLCVPLWFSLVLCIHVCSFVFFFSFLLTHGSAYWS